MCRNILAADDDVNRRYGFHVQVKDGVENMWVQSRCQMEGHPADSFVFDGKPDHCDRNIASKLKTFHTDSGSIGTADGASHPIVRC
jgi:hypothetical protein